MAAFRDLFPTTDIPQATRLLTEREVTRVLGLSRTTLWRLRKDGLPTLSVGRSVRYDVDKTREWLASSAEKNENAKLPILPKDGLAECHWSLSVAFDPKHRPQDPNRPSSTVRREWWRYPQEAHLHDRVGGRYRRLTAPEVAVIQDFPSDWGRNAVKDELLLMRGYGDAVPPSLAQALFSQIPSLLQKAPVTTLEVCAGFGGLTLGKSRALTLKHIGVFERWNVACEVLRHSGIVPPDIVREMDLHDVDWSEFSGKVDLLTGGPPCQPWSHGGKGLGENDERDLLGTMPDVVSKIMPNGFVFENVPGLLSGENEVYARDLVQRLRDAGGPNSYGVALAVLNAADYGVPQARRRVFIVGAYGKSTTNVHDFFDRVFASRTHAEPRSAAALSLKPWQSIAQAVPDWSDAKALWRRWPTADYADKEEKISKSDEISNRKEIRPTIRIGLDWPSRGSAVSWKEGTWSVSRLQDSTVSSRTLPLLPSAEDSAKPDTDPWVALGDPSVSLDALRRQLGRDAKLVYVDLPRIRTNAGVFDAGDREQILDTWLSMARAILRRSILLLHDSGAIAVLCGIDETPYARLLLDELAGPQNHLGTVAWQKGYSPRNMPNMKELSPVHDNILFFARRLDSLPPVSLRLPTEGFSNRDMDPRGHWKAEQKGANKPDCDYEIHICPYRWEIVSGELPPGIWRINPKTGVIWGKEPNVLGSWPFTVRVTDKSGTATDREFVIDVSDEGANPPLAAIPWLIAGRDEHGATNGGPDARGKLRISTDRLPKAKLNHVYSACLEAKGGQPWSGTTRPGKTSKGGKGRYWEFPVSTLLVAAAEDRVDFKSKDDAIPAIKTYDEGDDRTLNQTTMWFGRSRSSGAGDKAPDPTDVDYSQDAKKELAALEEAGFITETVATSKPAKLMARLLALFTTDGSTVVDIGSPAAEMASIATALGRSAIFIPLSNEGNLADRLWIPRLKLAACGEHPIPSNIIFSQSRSESTAGYFIQGKARQKEPQGNVLVLRQGPSFAEIDGELGIASIDYKEYPAGSLRFLMGLASVEGLVPTQVPGLFGKSRDNRVIASYFSPEHWLAPSDVDALKEMHSTWLDAGAKLRVYFHRGPIDPDTFNDHRIELRRIPFALVLAAGLG